MKMNALERLKTPIKNVRWGLRRNAVARKFGEATLEQMPIVIGNAMPKSGSHLLHQILLGISQIAPFVDPGMPPLTRSAKNKNLPVDGVLKKLNGLRPGDIAYGYFQARPEYLAALTASGRASIFITRDPRDVLVSHVFYATEMYSGHGMHSYYNSLPDMEARLNAAIEGVDADSFQLSGIRAKYDCYLGWITTPGVENVAYEDLILEQAQALGQIVTYLLTKGLKLDMSIDEAIAKLGKSIRPSKSGTFRGGRVGDWQEHFTSSNKERFKAAAGDLLQILNYEEDNRW